MARIDIKIHGKRLRGSWRRILAVAALGACVVGIRSADAVILFGTGDSAANTTPPTGVLANSGWQYEGGWGAFLGTPIAPNFFLSAQHIGQAGSSFSYLGTTYTLVKSFPDPIGDLLIWQVVETFPAYAPLYPREDEVSQPLVVIGRGTQRGVVQGDPSGNPCGWDWGTSDSVERWGQNTVATIADLGGGDDTLHATFDQGAGTNEAQLSVGDSGGAVYLKDGGTWKLAGINYAVDEVFADAAGDGGLTAALYDTRGFYEENNDKTYSLITGTSPVPTGFYATRISSRLNWINSVINPSGDSTGSGVPNLLKYAYDLSPAVADVSGLPVFSLQKGVATLTYTIPVVPVDVTYTVEQSPDLITWTSATATTKMIGSASNGGQIIQATVTTSGTPSPFLRMRVTRP